MPPKRQQQQHVEEPSESEEDDMGEMDGIDLMRFANPNYAREFKAKLPAKIRDRVKALEALDEDYKKLKAEMSKAVDAAEREFQVAIAPLAASRAKIVKGEAEPTEEEVNSGFSQEHKEAGVTIDGAVNTSASKGIPNFWLEALQHHVIIQEFISDRDATALESVSDVTCTVLNESEGEGFTIAFHFNENPYFTNTVLSKTFTLTRDEDNAVLSKAVGTVINWKDGKNLGVKTVTKKIKSKTKKGQVKFVTSEEPCPTFFDFFAQAKEDAEDDQDEEEWMAMAETLKDKIIPFAAEYFTGEAANGESDLEEDDYGDEEEEEEEEEEEPPAMMRGRGRGGYQAPAPGGKRGGAGPSGGRGGAGQQDCKQQ